MTYDNPFSLEAYVLYREACGWGCEYELHVRLLADKTPALEHTFKQNLEDAEEAIVAHFRAHVDTEEEALLASVRVLRNKLLHADFSKARKELKKFGYAPDAVVAVARLPDVVTMKGLLEALHGAKAMDMEAVTQGNVFGWLLTHAGDGSFAEAGSLFRRGIEVIDTLSLLE